MSNYEYADKDGLSALAEQIFAKIKPKLAGDIDSALLSTKTVTKSGNPLVVETYAAQTAKDVKLRFNPVSHTGDRIWGRGDGRNHLPTTPSILESLNDPDGEARREEFATVLQYDGLTFAIEYDDNGNLLGIRVKGTADNEDGDDTRFELVSTFYISSPMKLVFAVPLPSGVTFSYSRYYSNGDADDELTSTNLPAGSYGELALIFEHGEEFYDYIQPMLLLQTDTDMTYESTTNYGILNDDDFQSTTITRTNANSEESATFVIVTASSEWTALYGSLNLETGTFADDMYPLELGHLFDPEQYLGNLIWDYDEADADASRLDEIVCNHMDVAIVNSIEEAVPYKLSVYVDEENSVHFLFNFPDIWPYYESNYEEDYEAITDTLNEMLALQETFVYYPVIQENVSEKKVSVSDTPISLLKGTNILTAEDGITIELSYRDGAFATLEDLVNLGSVDNTEDADSIEF